MSTIPCRPSSWGGKGSRRHGQLVEIADSEAYAGPAGGACPCALLRVGLSCFASSPAARVSPHSGFHPRPCGPPACPDRRPAGAGQRA
ncbi:hypothetical protein E1J24_20270 [Xanthomonas hortorum pv. pelargonii]|uniref:Uncharacterized protein n=1 Tax=Xanthomonas hortorum pv. pelargonii TaxID=453602 RepID=A0AAW9ZWA6_9XANT|nr:hypothetical protein [Xanthomonas hortorum pv. pelargonii]